MKKLEQLSTMQFFKKSVGEHPKFQKLCNRVKYFKETQKGADLMCQNIEEYVAEKVKQNEVKMATRLLESGVSVDLVAKSTSTLTYDFIVELSKRTVVPDSI